MGFYLYTTTVALGYRLFCGRRTYASSLVTNIIAGCTHAGRSRLQVLILPGNPGSAGYYEAYIAALHAALHGQADVHAVSHLGHASSRKARQYGNKVQLLLTHAGPPCAIAYLALQCFTRNVHIAGQAFSLQEQINHKVAYIYQHMSQQQPIAIIGHSIGENMHAQSQGWQIQLGCNY